jgi:tetratricopeptide (TPR) repeat protein
MASANVKWGKAMISGASRSLIIFAARTLALVSVVSFLIPPASAQQSQSWKLCTDATSLDQRVSACSAIIESATETFDNLARAYGNRGVAYDNKGEFDQAARDYEESVRLDPTSAFGHRVRGNLYKLKKDYDRAIAEYNESISIEPNDAHAFSNRGSVYYAKKDYDRAVGEFSEAIRLDPAYTIAFYGRGLARLATLDTAHAIADFNEAIRLEPRFVQAYAVRGTAYAKIKQYESAIDNYTEALSMEPPERLAASTFSNRCWARFVVGRDPQDILADCTKAIGLRPDDAWALNTRGFTYLKLGETDRSIADFTAAVTVNSKMAISLYGRGLARQRAGDGHASENDIEMARMIRPDIVEAAAIYDVH